MIIEEYPPRRIDRFSRVEEQSLTRYRDHRGFTMSYRWQTNGFALILWIFWTIATAAILYGMLFSTNINPGDKWGIYLFCFTHPAISILTGYWALSGWLNKTFVKIRNGKITIMSRPFPWFGDKKDVYAGDINQLYVVKYQAYQQNKKPVYRFKVMAKTSREDFILLRGVPNSEIAKAIEKEIEEVLGLKNEPVEGEYHESNPIY